MTARETLHGRDDEQPLLQKIKCILNQIGNTQLKAVKLSDNIFSISLFFM